MLCLLLPFDYFDHMIQLTPYQLLQLRDAIESKCQIPIRNQADCLALSKKIEDSIEKKVSSHTLRRFFGIVLWHGQFRIKTMDILAHYAGYTSINTFVQELQSQANLTMYFENGEEKQKDSYLYEQLILKSPSLESIMVVGACIREALVREDIERVMQLLRALEPMAKKHQIHINALMLFAQYVAPMLCQVQEEMVVKRFIEDTPYVRLVLCQFVPVLELNGGFGNHIRWMLKYSTNHEHLAFGYSLFGSSSWRENDKEKAREYTRLAIKNREQLSSIHPILRGRIDFLSKIADNGIKTNLNASDFNPPKNQHLLYFSAIATEVVLHRQKKWSKLLCNSFNSCGQDVNNWIEVSFYAMQEIACLYSKCGVWTERKIREKLQEKKSAAWPKDHKEVAEEMIRIVEQEFA